MGSKVQTGPENPHAPWDPNKVQLTVQDLGNGAYLLVDRSSTKEAIKNGASLATNGGFIVTDEGVVVVETFINNRIACDARNLITQTTTKPIKYVVVTSSHGDHCFGNSVFDAEGVTFVMHKKTREYLGKKADGEKAFLSASLNPNAGISETKPIFKGMRPRDVVHKDIELVKGEVTVKWFGFAQTGGDVSVFHHASKTLWVGNPIIAIGGPTLPWLLDGHVDEVQQSLARMKKFMAEVHLTVPGHGPPSSNAVDTISNYEEYLTKLQDVARKSVKAGDNLAQMNEKSYDAVAEYTGYSVWQWVHYGMNVPFAFVEAGGKLEDGESCAYVCFAPGGFGVGLNSHSRCKHCQSGYCGGAAPEQKCMASPTGK